MNTDGHGCTTDLTEKFPSLCWLLFDLHSSAALDPYLHSDIERAPGFPYN